MSNQLERQKFISSQLQAEYNAYYKELQNAKKLFGEDSNEYREAATQLEDINKSLIESRTAELDLKHSIDELPFTVNKMVISRIENIVKRLSGWAQLIEKRGTVKKGASSGYATSMSDLESVYQDQMNYNNDLLTKYLEDYEQRNKQIKEEIAGGLEINSDRYKELYGELISDQEAMANLLSTQEDLKESIRNMRWKKYNDWKEDMDRIVADIQHLRGFIREEEKFDDNGQFTERGWTNIFWIGKEMDYLEQKLVQANGALEKIDEEWKNATISEETYKEEQKKYLDEIQQLSEEIYDRQQELADEQIEHWKRETDVLQEVIDKREEALQRKKDYYDYDKSLKNQNKDISMLQAQIAALSGVTGDAAVARRTQLQAELTEKQKDLDDFMYNHSIELQQEGYQKLSKDLQETLDKAIRLLQGDNLKLQSTTESLLYQVKNNKVNENAVVDGIISSRATQVSSGTKEALKEVVEPSIANIAKTIGDGTTDNSLLGFSAKISTTLNSLGQNIAGPGKTTLDDIIKAINNKNLEAEHAAAAAAAAKTQAEQKKKEEEAAKSNKVTTLTNDIASLKSSSQEYQNLAKKYAQQRNEQLAAVERYEKKLSKAKKKSTKRALQQQIDKARSTADSLWKEYKKYRDLYNSQTNLIQKKEAELKTLRGYASGAKRINKNQFAWTNEDFNKLGSELIVRPSDGAILTPLKANDSVIPPNLAENLFKWGAINPDSFATNPFMGKWGDVANKNSSSDIISNNNATQNISVHFDSLFNVQGNVDAGVVDQLEDLAKQLTKNRDFQQNVIKFVTKDFVRESKKQGFR